MAKRVSFPEIRVVDRSCPWTFHSVPHDERRFKDNDVERARLEVIQVREIWFP
jgi:hypothetical protein